MNPPTKTATRLSLADYLEAMSRAVFTAGISWRVIEAKWDGIRVAFKDFDPHKVARFTPHDVERLMNDPRVIRNRGKIEGVIANANELLATDKEFGGFDNYLTSFSDNDALIKDLHRRFKYLGESVAHFFLYGIGFNTPAQDKWSEKHFAGHDWGGHNPHHSR